MSIVKQEDGHGCSLKYVDTDGVRTSLFQKDPEVQASVVRGIPNFNCRPDDVFICAPVKSGTHWTWEIISMMCNGNTETIRKPKMYHMLEAKPEEELEKLPSPRILNTHMHLKYMPSEAKEMGCKIVYVLRNPKDLAVSLYNHNRGLPDYEYEGRWEHFLPLFLQGKTEYNSWFEYVLEWEERMSSNTDLPVHLVYFEDLKQNCLQEVNRLGNFLGIENKHGLFEAISEKCEFGNMVKDKHKYQFTEGVVFDGYSFYRKGIIGDWMNWFTVAQNEMFDQVYNEKMKHTKHKFRYTSQSA